MYSPCPTCEGSGRIKSAESISVELQRRLTDLLQRPSEEMSDLVITVHPEIMQRLKTEDSEHLISLERRYHGRLTFRSEPTQSRERVTFISAETGREIG